MSANEILMKKSKNSEENNYQRAGSISNAHVGREFEAIAKSYFCRARV